jgi:hypothetical protein
MALLRWKMIQWPVYADTQYYSCYSFQSITQINHRNTVSSDTYGKAPCPEQNYEIPENQLVFLISGGYNQQKMDLKMNNNNTSSFRGPEYPNINRTAPNKLPGGSGCTQALITGLTSLHGNMTGQCVDGSAGQWPGYIKLEIPEEGNRYLIVGGWAEEIFPLLNEKGVAGSQGLRLAKEYPPAPQGQPEYISSGEMMRTCNSASEYVSMWTDNFMRHGAPWGGRCNFVIDPEVGYCLEGANFVYGDPSNHVIHGPMYDQVFASANFYISKRLKMIAEAGIGAGYNRAKRLWQLLIDRQYDGTVMQPRMGGISFS